MRPQLGERIITAINTPPQDAPHARRNDALLALACAVSAVLLGLKGQDGPRPDALGWVLLLAVHPLLVWRREHPMRVLVVALALIATYHALDNDHSAPAAATMVVLYTIAATGTVRRTLIVGGCVLGMTLTVNVLTNPEGVGELLRISGWVLAALFCGIDVRFYRAYVASIVERAERAERTREEEAARRVAEERLRIARDLHDLLAHSITLIGVQTSVASHVLTVDPERLDRAAISRALDDISETCRTARGELRSTLEVLREAELPDGRGPLPGLTALPDLADSARTAGAQVTLDVRVTDAPAAVGAAVYRLVQEALTNAVRHAGPGVKVTVNVVPEGGWGLRLSVEDEGPEGPPPVVTGSPGYGLVGMRERVRSVGGTLDAAPREAGGFAVTAVLPLNPSVVTDTTTEGARP